MIKNKRGQFYLIAALVIIVIIVGYAAISNYTQKRDYVRTYNLAEELEIESAEVLDYGVYQDIDTPQMRTLLENLVEAYSKKDLDELYFVFGNKNEIIFIGYNQLEEVLNAGVTLDEGAITHVNLGDNSVTSTVFSGEDIKKVSVEINYDDGTKDEYEFNL